MRVSIVVWFSMLAVVPACASSSSGSTSPCPAGFVCTPASDVSASGDSAAADSPTVDAGADDSISDAQATDTQAADIAVDAGAAPDAGQDSHETDGGFWTPPDIEQQDSASSPEGSKLYVHTKDTLYVLNPNTLAFDLIGMFTFNKNAGLVTDIALNKAGAMYAVTYTDLFVCEISTAKCAWLATLPQEFNGLTYVPAGLIDKQQEVLVGIAGKGTWYRIDFDATGAKLTALGSYGGGWWSSGDAFSVVGVGTYATLKKCNNCDNYLAEIEPSTGAVKKVIGKTGNAKWLFGLAWFANVFYGVSQDGNVYMLDVNTAQPTKVQGVKVPSGVQWWGAGVSTHTSLLGGG